MNFPLGDGFAPCERQRSGEAIVFDAEKWLNAAVVRNVPARLPTACTFSGERWK